MPKVSVISQGALIKQVLKIEGDFLTTYHERVLIKVPIDTINSTALVGDSVVRYHSIVVLYINTAAVGSRICCPEILRGCGS